MLQLAPGAVLLLPPCHAGLMFCALPPCPPPCPQAQRDGALPAVRAAAELAAQLALSWRHDLQSGGRGGAADAPRLRSRSGLAGHPAAHFPALVPGCPTPATACADVEGLLHMPRLRAVIMNSTQPQVLAMCCCSTVEHRAPAFARSCVPAGAAAWPSWRLRTGCPCPMHTCRRCRWGRTPTTSPGCRAC